MSHIHSKPGQIDFTVTIYVFRQDGKELKTMLHMHKKLGKLLPVGGHVELDETPWQAVAHELEEESGYEIANVKVLQPAQRIKQLSGVTLHPQPIALNTHDIPDNHFHSDITYAFCVENEPTKSLADGEAEDIRWLSKAELYQLDEDKIFINTKEVCTYIMDNFEQWDLIDASDFSLEKGYK